MTCKCISKLSLMQQCRLTWQSPKPKPETIESQPAHAERKHSIFEVDSEKHKKALAAISDNVTGE